MNKKRYMQIIDEAMKLVVSRNDDYGESVDHIDIRSIAQLCMMKLSRVEALGDEHLKTKDEFQDTLNYCVFALEKFNNKTNEKEVQNDRI